MMGVIKVQVFNSLDAKLLFKMKRKARKIIILIKRKNESMLTKLRQTSCFVQKLSERSSPNSSSYRIFEEESSNQTFPVISAQNLKEDNTIKAIQSHVVKR